MLLEVFIKMSCFTAMSCSRVQDMFHSVQLNVNNPHFLIMQGRITKVLNMRPIEILGLLEEAAGTTMYNKKRDAALKTLERKKKQLEEIDEVIWLYFCCKGCGVLLWVYPVTCPCLAVC